MLVAADTWVVVGTIAAVIAAITGTIAAFLPWWWRRPHLRLEPGSGWSPGTHSIGLPLEITNEGDRPVFELRVVGLCNGKPVTIPIVIAHLLPNTPATTIAVDFNRPEYIDIPPGGMLQMPSGQLSARATLNRHKWTRDF